MKDGFATPLILVKGGVKYRNRNLQNLIIIYILFPVSLVIIIIMMIIIIIIKGVTPGLWKSRTKVVPVIVGALGSVSKKLASHLEQIGIKNRTRTIQKSALLGSAHILRKVLEV